MNTKKMLTFFTQARFSYSEDTITTNREIHSELKWHQYLASLESTTFDMALAARVFPQGEKKYQVKGNFFKIYPQDRLKNIVKNFILFNRSIKETVKSSDIIGIVSPLAPIHLIAYFQAKRNKKLILIQVLGDAWSMYRYGEYGNFGKIILPLVMLVERKIIKSSHAVRYVGQEILSHRYPPSPKAKVSAFSDVVIDEIHQTKSSIEKDGIKILTIGDQNVKYKAQDLLIHTFFNVSKCYSDAELHIIGEGRLQPSLKALVVDLNLESKVKFLGYVGSRNEIFQLLDSATLFVLPSLQEGLPRALVEAMSRGIPCISTNVGGVPELLDNDSIVSPGNVTELTDKILEFIENKDIRTKNISHGLHKARMFTSENLAHKQKKMATTN